jgi:hypothetical protein
LEEIIFVDKINSVKSVEVSEWDCITLLILMFKGSVEILFKHVMKIMTTRHEARKKNGSLWAHLGRYLIKRRCWGIGISQ